MDDDIYAHLKAEFPEFDPAATINEEEMKSKSGKERWRKFMMAYDKKVDDYNFGTMLRTSPSVEYEKDTTIFGIDIYPLAKLRQGKPPLLTRLLSSPEDAILRHRDSKE